MIKVDKRHLEQHLFLLYFHTLMSVTVSGLNHKVFFYLSRLSHPLPQKKTSFSVLLIQSTTTCYQAFSFAISLLHT